VDQNADPFEDLLLLVDGHSMAFRAYYALPDSLRTPEGEPVQAVYGFINMLFRLLEDYRPRWVGFTFDQGRPFRHDLYDAYKAGREDIPDDIRTQVAHLRRILTAMGGWQVAGAPFEADDYMATLARQAEEAGTEVLVVSGDRDLFQVVGPRVRVLYPIKGIKESVVYDPATVQERFGVSPTQLTDWKAMVGDSSDNIPGVKGIGEKGAAKLLQEHGDLAGIYAALDQFTAGMRRKLEEGRESCDLSRSLAALRYDAPTVLDLPAMELRYDRDAVAGVMREYGFESTIKRLPEAYLLG
jgi:DNA polymerase-1